MKKISLIIVCYCSIQFSLIAQTTISGKNIPRDTSYTVYQTYIKIHKDYPEARPAKAILPEGVVAERDLVYTVLKDSINNGRKLHLDLFRPAKQGSFPAVIMVHGGGWRSGDKSMQVPLAMMIAAKGYVTVAVEYQLSLEAKYPAAVYNIKSAIRWIRANAVKYGIDTSRIAISGCSAGGQLAALVGMTNGVARFEGNYGNSGYSSKVHAVMDIDGVLDFLAPASLNMERNPNSADVAWFGGTYMERPGIWKEASSIFWVTKNSPPALFLNSGFSRFHAGQDEMIAILNESGIYSEVHKFDVKVHPFWLFHPWFEPTTEYMIEFLNKTLNSQTP
jgi:acetyl esterase/lipase